MDAQPLPAELRGPVPLTLARAEDDIPTPASLRGAAMYELKWDGFRCAIVKDSGAVRLWSRQGKDLTAAFADVARAADVQLEDGTVLDGELVIWNGARLDFDLLARRLTNRARPVTTGPAATYMVFDLLAVRGHDLRSLPTHERRDLLEAIAGEWAPPLQVSPVTWDLEVAQQWFEDYRPAGIEGLVVKGANDSYRPGHRDWIKVKNRQTTEVIIGAVTGSLEHPESIIAGPVVGDVLRMVGRSVPLTRAQAGQVALVLSPAAPAHPWPDEISNVRFGSGRDKVPISKVDPTVVVEVLADAALLGGAFRHPVRFVRLRPDLDVDDLRRSP
jgi:ATP-dependent DNA ligase